MECIVTSTTTTPIACLSFNDNLNRTASWSLLCIYGTPTGYSCFRVKDGLHERLSLLIRSVRPKDLMVVGGDFNAQLDFLVETNADFLA